jgi:hypothetical protein
MHQAHTQGLHHQAFAPHAETGNMPRFEDFFAQPVNEFRIKARKRGLDFAERLLAHG